MSKKEAVQPVHQAVMRHHLPEVTQAIEQGEDVDALDREGRTALFYATSEGEPTIAAELIRHGANVNAQDKRLQTALHFAASAFQPEIAELLLKSGASVDAPDVNGNTPLSNAVFDSRGRDQMIKLLLSFGANKTLKNKHGVSPEDLAKSIGNYDVSKFLL
jgi:ankyrin repeat protein